MPTGGAVEQPPIATANTSKTVRVSDPCKPALGSTRQFPSMSGAPIASGDVKALRIREAARVVNGQTPLQQAQLEQELLATTASFDDKTCRRSHDGKAGRAPLHLVSAFAFAFATTMAGARLPLSPAR